MQNSAGCQEALGAGRGEDLEAKLLNASPWGCASGAPCAGDKTPACQGLEEASSEETIAPCCFAHPKEMMLILGILEDWGLLLVLQHIRGCFHGPLHPTILLQTGERSPSEVSEASSVMDSISSLESRKSHPYKSPFFPLLWEEIFCQRAVLGEPLGAFSTAKAQQPCDHTCCFSCPLP